MATAIKNILITPAITTFTAVYKNGGQVQVRKDLSPVALAPPAPLERPNRGITNCGYGRNWGPRLQELDSSFARRNGERIKAKMAKSWISPAKRLQIEIERAQFWANVQTPACIPAPDVEKVRAAMPMPAWKREKAARRKAEADARAQAAAARKATRAAEKVAKQRQTAAERAAHRAHVKSTWAGLKARKMTGAVMALALFLAAQRRQVIEDRKTGRGAGQAKVYITKAGQVVETHEVSLRADSSALTLAIAGALQGSHGEETLRALASNNAAIYVKMGGSLFTIDDFLHKERQRFRCSVEIEVVLG